MRKNVIASRAKQDVQELKEKYKRLLKIPKEILESTRGISREDARFLVDAFYSIQEDRKRYLNQQRAIKQKYDEKHAASTVIAWLGDVAKHVEMEIEKALDAYTDGHIMASWMRQVRGVGPVISAGLLAMIDIEKAPTVGHIWRYAGLDPTVKWEKGKTRPWNAELKTLCWKIGDCFVKHSGHPDCYYGHIYRYRKEYEIMRNDAGLNRELAAELLKNAKPGTQNYLYLSNGKLSPGHLDNRARRYAVKLFLSHMHAEWYRRHYQKEPPLPYPIQYLGHVHLIVPTFLGAA